MSRGEISGCYRAEELYDLNENLEISLLLMHVTQTRAITESPGQEQRQVWEDTITMQVRAHHGPDQAENDREGVDLKIGDLK